MKRKQMEPIEPNEEVIIDENFLNKKRKERFENMFKELFNEKELLYIIYSFTDLKKQSIECLIEEKKAYFVEEILTELKDLFVEKELTKLILEFMGYDTKMYGCYSVIDTPYCDYCYSAVRELEKRRFSVEPFKITDDIPASQWLLRNGVGITNDTYYQHDPCQIIQPHQIVNQNDTNLYYNSEVRICIGCDRHYRGTNIDVIFTEHLCWPYLS